jgi:hypothetical protein
MVLTHPHAGDVAIIIDEAPLMADQVQPENMVIDLVCVLIETPEGIDLIISTVSYRGVNKTRRPLPKGTGHSRPVPIHCGSLFRRRIWQNEGIVGGCRRIRGGNERGGVENLHWRLQLSWRA